MTMAMMKEGMMTGCQPRGRWGIQQLHQTVVDREPWAVVGNQGSWYGADRSSTFPQDRQR